MLACQETNNKDLVAQGILAIFIDYKGRYFCVAKHWNLLEQNGLKIFLVCYIAFMNDVEFCRIFSANATCMLIQTCNYLNFEEMKFVSKFNM